MVGMIELAPLMIPADTFETAMPVDVALSKMRHHLEMPLSYLSVFDGDDVVCRAMSGCVPSSRPVIGVRQPADGSLCAAVRDGVLPQLVADLSHYTDRHFTSPCGTRVNAFVAIPLLLPDGGLSGTFCCASPVAMPDLNQRDHSVVQSCVSRLGDTMRDQLDLETRHTSLRTRIEDIISDRDFQLLLQPIVNLETNRVTGAEALCRFRPTPYRSPDAWFADAEKVGLRAELERTVLQKALELLPELPRPLKLSINLSARSMAEIDVLPLVDGPCSDRIVLELTNLTDLGDLTGLQIAIRNMRDLGVEIAVDGIAPDHASFCMIMQLKPDIVKLDRELVRGIHMDPANQALTTAVIHFANAIGAAPIAGGIERVEETSMLKTLGVMQGQGFLVGRPGGLQALMARMYSY